MGDFLPTTMNTLSVIGISVSIFGIMATTCILNPVAYGQTPPPQTPVNITDILIENYPYISVEYEDPSTVVIRGDEESLLLINGTLAPFWEGKDKPRSKAIS